MSTRHSPAVSMAIQRPWWLYCVCGLILGASAVLLAAQQAAWLPLVVSWGLWAGCTVWAWQGLRSLPQGRLSWDGLGWTWESSPKLQQRWSSAPEVLLDMQQAMLLVFRPPSQPARCMWMQRNWSPGQWLAFRRAVYSSANSRAESADT